MYNGYKEIFVEKQNKLVIAKFNKPQKRNCLNTAAYREITRILHEIDQDENVTLLILTGVGDFYTAGNDLLQSKDITDIDAFIKESNRIFKNMVLAFINCTKLIVSLVNGPCIGVGATLAAISDLVWCSDQAYFLTPFVKLGLVPEAASSYLFPLIMGRSRATEILLCGEKLTAYEALQCNFVSRIYKTDELLTDIWPRLQKYSELPYHALRISKKLMRTQEIEFLIRAIELECSEIPKRVQSEEFFNALKEFYMNKSKL